MMDRWLRSVLACPIDGSALTDVDAGLTCEGGHRFPVVEGVPILLRDDVVTTHSSIAKTLAEVKEHRVHELMFPIIEGSIDPVVQVMVSATCGYLYEPLVGKLDRYPVPELRLADGDGRTLLDIGCNWGRWTFAAGRKGYRAIGLDPDLGPILAAKRVAQQLGLSPHFVVGDARYLPFLPQSLETVFSYSVIQHFSKEDAALAFGSIGRVLRSGGTSMVQMPNAYGMRSTFHRIRNPRPARFDVRYWSPGQLLETCERLIGPSELSIDGFFGLGVQAADIDMLPLRFRAVVVGSEALRRLARVFPALLYVADSLYVTSTS